MSSLTHADCQQIADNYLKTRHVPIKSFNLESIKGEKKGHLGEYSNLTINFEDGRESIVFFVKDALPAPNRPEFVNMATEKEVKFYQYIMEVKSKSCKMNTSFMPKCYFISEKCIVMDDLTAANYETPKCIDEKHIKLALKCLTKLHAIGFKFGVENLDFLEEAMFSIDNQYIGSVYMNAITEGICNYIGEKDQNLQNQLREEVRKSLQLLNNNHNFPQVCCHGDLWMNNLLYKYENNVPTDCRIIDYQLVRSAPSAHDVTTVIFHNANPEIIKNHLDDFLIFYYNHLTSELKEYKFDIKQLLSFEDYMSSCKTFIPVAKITKLLYLGFETATKKRASQKVKKSLDEVMLENNGDFISCMTQADTSLKSKFETQLQDIEEMSKHAPLNRESCQTLLNQILKSNYNIVDIRTMRPRKIMNIDGEFYLLQLTVEQNNEIKEFKFTYRVCVKDKAEKFTQEYEFIKYNMDVTPKCYLAVKADIIIYEYFEKDYEFIPSRKPFGLDEAKCVIRALAQLHSKGFEFSKSTKAAGINFEKTIEVVLNQLKLFPKSSIKLTDFVDFIQQNVNKERSVKTKNTICHNSLDNHSILLKFENMRPISCKFINFQNYTHGPPTDDFYNFVNSCTLKSFREYFLDDLKDYYYAELCKCLGEKSAFYMDRDSFDLSCEESAFHCALRAVVYHQRALLDEKMFELGDECQCRKATMLKKSLIDDPIYLQRQEEAIEELVELYCKQIGQNNTAI